MALNITEKLNNLKEDIMTNYKNYTEDQIFFHIREAKDLNG